MNLPVFIITGTNRGSSFSAASVEQLADALHTAGLETRRASSFADGLSLVSVYPDYGCIILDWDIEGTDEGESGAVALIHAIRGKSKRVPIFLLCERSSVADFPLEVVREVQEYIHLFTDTPSFIAGRVQFAVRRYADALLPPYFKALRGFAKDAPYYWDCPGHMGGVAYLKHPVGAEFHRFFGENIMRADVGIMASPLGDWLKHQGPPGESEENAARIFGADRTYYVVGGSSISNQIVAHGTVARKQPVIVDRNCHKSLNHALTVTDAQPLYLNPKRNGYGLLGLIPLAEFEPARLRARLREAYAEEQAALAIVTNSTYDGLCYAVGPVTERLARVTRQIHYDEAWYAYAHFHPLYAGRYAMHEDSTTTTPETAPVVFAVHSTHKMLAAFSMASMIHVKNADAVEDGQKLFDHGRFNEAFMMHGTTSPFYPLLASIDVATAMMEAPSGPTLMREAIADAVDFRRAIKSAAEQLGPQQWFFDVFQPPGRGVFDDEVIDNPDFWVLEPGQAWHGFDPEDIADGHCMLDPTKVTVLCPGIDATGRFGAMGIPAKVVAQFLDARRITIAKSGDYTILVLFSIGTSKGKWGTLREALLDFKNLHDSGASVAEAIPALAEAHPEVYGCFDSKLPTDDDYRRMLDGQPVEGGWRFASVRDLCRAMHAAMRALNIPERLNAACDAPPRLVYNPGEAYQQLVMRNTVVSPLRAGMVAAGMIVPYPPGIPILMPGEMFQPAHVDFLTALEVFGRVFPGFEPGVHGLERDAEGKFSTRELVRPGALATASAEPEPAPRLHARFKRASKATR